MKYIITCSLVLLFFFSQAQNRVVDSLTNIVANTTKIKVKVNALLDLFELHKKNDLSKAKVYANDVLALSIKNDYKLGIASGHNAVGLVYKYSGEYQKSIEEFDKAIKIFSEIKDNSGLASSFNNIALSLTRMGKLDEALNYHRQAYQLRIKNKDSLAVSGSMHNLGLVHELRGNYLRALKYYQKAYNYKKLLKDERGAGVTLGNIGNIYVYEKDFTNAIKYYKKSLKSRLKYNNERGVAVIISNIGAVFNEIGMLDSSLTYYQKALEINDKIHNIEGQASVLGNIGTLYYKQGNYVEAERYYLKSLDLSKKLKNTTLECSVLTNLSELFVKKEQYVLAERYLKKALILADELGSKRMLSAIYDSYSKLYKGLGDFQKAFEYSEKFMVSKGSLENAEIKNMQTKFNDMQHEYELEMQEKQIKLLEKQKEVERANNKVLIIGITLIIIIVLIVGAFFVYRFKLKQRALEVTRAQKKIIDEKNKDITDSINYASTIQDAIMPTTENFVKKFKISFGLFIPKDIVSGDFYWTYNKGEYKFIAVVDCTGHGVPGAFMSMLGITFLNQIVEQSKDTSPGNILSQLHIEITKALKQTADVNSNKDGMDIALCRLSLDNKILEYAGAYNPLLIARKEELVEIKADRFSIGGGMPEEKIFKSNIVDVKKGDWCYLFTDGYQDQFGGPNTKKYSIKRLKELLIEVNQLESKKQYAILKEKFYGWKGTESQIDDVTLIGFQI